MARGLKPVFGAGGVGTTPDFATPEVLQETFKVLEAGGCHNIDTARLYGPSEETLGKSKAAPRFVIDSKTPGGFAAGGSTAAGIVAHAKETVERLGTDSVDIYYIHSPDDSIPLEDMLKGIDDAYKAGYFKRFGLSNFKAADVERVHGICKANGYPLPKVYQANYSPVARRQETELFPTLRKLDMACYVYSPMAGGFLTKTRAQIEGGGPDAGRWHKENRMNSLYGSLYQKPAYLKALDLWAEAAEAAGCGKAELAYRWVSFDSPLSAEQGDAIIFGASKLQQVKETLGWLQAGSVGEAAKAKIDEIWKTIEHEAPLDNFHG